MNSKLNDFLSSVPLVWKIAGIISSAFGAGITTALLLVTIFGLPEKVAANQSSISENDLAITALEEEVEDLQEGQDRIICILEQQLLHQPRICP